MLREVPMRMFNVYAKLNREKKHFERAKVNSRSFHWFPAAMFILNTIIFSDILCQITRVPNIVHPQNFGTLFIYYSSTIFEFPDLIFLMVSDFIFHLRDNQASLLDVKTNTCLFFKTDILLVWENLDRGLYTRPRSRLSHADRLCLVNKMFIMWQKQEQFNSFNVTGLY